MSTEGIPAATGIEFRADDNTISVHTIDLVSTRRNSGSFKYVGDGKVLTAVFISSEPMLLTTLYADILIIEQKS